MNSTDDRASDHWQNEEHDHESDVANPVVNPQRVIGKKMADDVAAIERRQRDQIEDAEHHVDQDCEREQLVPVARLHPRRESLEPIPATGSVQNDRQSDDGEKGRQEIADRPGDGGKNVVAHRVLEVPGVHRRRLGPAERGEAQDDQE